jgi:hypothetical protein
MAGLPDQHPFKRTMGYGNLPSFPGVELCAEIVFSCCLLRRGCTLCFEFVSLARARPARARRSLHFTAAAPSLVGEMIAFRMVKNPQMWFGRLAAFRKCSS